MHCLISKKTDWIEISREKNGKEFEIVHWSVYLPVVWNNQEYVSDSCTHIVWLM